VGSGERAGPIEWAGVFWFWPGEGEREENKSKEAEMGKEYLKATSRPCYILRDE